MKRIYIALIIVLSVNILFSIKNNKLLNISITSESEMYTTSDSINVLLTFENTSKNLIRFKKPYGQFYKYFRFIIDYSNGKDRVNVLDLFRNVPISLRTPSSLDDWIFLKPGEKYYTEINLREIYNRKNKDGFFNSKGIYYVSVHFSQNVYIENNGEFSHPNHYELITNEIELEIVEGTLAIEDK